MNFLSLDEKYFLMTGVSNKKSVAYHTAKLLKEFGAKLVFSVQSEEHLQNVERLFPEDPIFICNVEDQESIKNFGLAIEKSGIFFSGMLHSIAFANYSEGIKPFLETNSADFMQATQISCLSFVNLANVMKERFTPEASLVTVSISSTRATSYGYMGPIKAALDATVPFMAKSFSEFSKVRVNAVCSGPLKTSASAGIPGYIDNYIYAEKLTLRKKALATLEVANTIAFLLSPRSSGINGERIVVDAGMASNYFDQEIVSTIANNS